VTNKWYLPFKIRRRLIGCECTVEEEAAFPWQLHHVNSSIHTNRHVNSNGLKSPRSRSKSPPLYWLQSLDLIVKIGVSNVI
jgi:hypothetical protein